MLLIGIDQSKEKHDICITDDHGRQLAREVVSHRIKGFERIHELCRKFDVPPQQCLVALESSYSLLVDYLLDEGYQVHIVPGKSVDRYRDRHRQSSSACDKGDAAVLARILLTDRGQHPPLEADSPLTRQIRSQVRLVSGLKRTGLRLANQLRDLLWRYYPGAVDMFAQLDRPVSLAFIQTYPTPQAAEALTQAEYVTFCRANRLFRKDHIIKSYTKLKGVKTCASPEIASAYAPQAQALAKVLQSLVCERKEALKALQQTFQQHPDAFVFESLPGTGDLLAPALLSKFRDSRNRFPTAAVAQAIAGTCPVTKQSGKYRHVLFRRSCDREFRYIITQFARCSINQSSWALAYFQTVQPRCEKVSQAYRCLANRWIAIIWRLWTDRVAYDEEIQLRNRFDNRGRN